MHLNASHPVTYVEFQYKVETGFRVGHPGLSNLINPNCPTQEQLITLVPGPTPLFAKFLGR